MSGASRFAAVRQAAHDATLARVVPGGVILVAEGEHTHFLEAFGCRQLEPEPAPASIETVYDLASLTKALATSVVAMRAVEQGTLSLDDRLSAHVPGFSGPDKDSVTIRQVLSHAGGFVPHRPFYRSVLQGGALGDAAEARRRVVELAAAEPLAYAPGTRSLYSDLGFILLGAALERRLGAALSELMAALPAAAGLTYGVAASGLGADADVAPTEHCPVRGGLVCGQVHDLNAYAMGGVAGHAGLFGTAAAVAGVARALLAAYTGAAPRAGEAPLVDRDVLRAFWSPAGVPGSTWRLGWDGPSAAGSLAGDLVSRAAVGHLGFTGCSLWIDPAREAFVVILTNRVHPTVRDDPRFRALRRTLNDAAWAGLLA